MDTENWNNDEFESADVDSEYAITLTKKQIMFLGLSIDAYTQLLNYNVDKISNDKELLTQVLAEVEVMVEVGELLMGTVGIVTKDGYMDEFKSELQTMKDELEV